MDSHASRAAARPFRQPKTNDMLSFIKGLGSDTSGTQNTLLIMASNIGSQFIFEMAENNDEEEMKKRVMDALKAHFKPEFLNRVDDVMIYHQLERSQIGHIAELQLERVKKLLSEKRLDLDITTGAIDLLSEQGYDPQYGARPLKRVIQRMLQDPLAIQILEGKFPEGSKIRVDVGSNGEDLEFERYS